jgi:hypothetical protein
MRGCPERNGVVHSINQLTRSSFFSNFSTAIQVGKSTINLLNVLNIWLQRFIFSGYLIHVIDDVVFSSAKTHLPTDSLIVAIRLPRIFLKPSRASGQTISESLSSSTLFWLDVPYNQQMNKSIIFVASKQITNPPILEFEHSLSVKQQCCKAIFLSQLKVHLQPRSWLLTSHSPCYIWRVFHGALSGSLSRSPNVAEFASSFGQLENLSTIQENPECRHQEHHHHWRPSSMKLERFLEQESNRMRTANHRWYILYWNTNTTNTEQCNIDGFKID